MAKTRNYYEDVVRTFKTDQLYSYDNKDEYIREVGRISDRRENHILKIMKMLDDLPDSNNLVKIRLIKKELLRNTEMITRGWDSDLDIELLIKGSKDIIKRRLDSIE